VPIGCEPVQPLKRKRDYLVIQRPVALAARQCGNALDRGSPPHQHGGILRRKRLQPPARFFDNE
jgi:hypothetical protein